MQIATNHINLNINNSNYAQETLRKSNADAACLFLFNRSIVHTSPISFINNSGIPEKVVAEYSDSVFRYDPILKQAGKALNKKMTIGAHTNQQLPKEQSERRERRRYWNCVGRDGIHEVAACVQPLTSNLHLVVGLLLQKNYQHITLDKALNCIESWLSESRDYLIESSIQNFYPELSNQGIALSIGLRQQLDSLTQRESEVVSHILEGKSNKQISLDLKLSEYTIENHLRHIYKKMNIHNRTALIAKMYRT